MALLPNADAKGYPEDADEVPTWTWGKFRSDEELLAFVRKLKERDAE